MQVHYPCFIPSESVIYATCLKAKGQLTKANQTKTKMENLARELQKVR